MEQLKYKGIIISDYKALLTILIKTNFYNDIQGTLSLKLEDKIQDAMIR